VPRLDEAIGFHPSIRFVVTANKEGKILDAVKRRGIVSLEPTSQMRAIADRFAIAGGLANASDEYFGKPRAIIVLREKLVEMVFPIENRLVIVSATPRFPIGRIGDLEKMLKSL